MSILRGLSLFANVGIAEAQLNEIGVEIVLANELLEKRAKVYQAIYPRSQMICGDIIDSVVRDTIVSKAIELKVNFIIATPPCQGMSVAGNRNPNDERNFLIYYAIDIIKRVKPDFVFLENVPKQLSTKILVGNEYVSIPDYIKCELSKSYNFNNITLAKAMDFGIPQIRERNIFLLSKKGINVHWEFPQKKETIDLFHAIGDLPELDPLLKEGYALTKEKFPKFDQKRAIGLEVSKWHKPPQHPWRQVEWMMHTPTGKSAIYNEQYYPQKKDGTKIKAHHNNYRRMRWDAPSRTITMFNGFISTLATVHPGREYVHNGEHLYSDPRVLSIYELMIVMSIPTNWPIPEWVDDSFLRAVIGEGIPSKMAKDIIDVLVTQLKSISYK